MRKCGALVMITLLTAFLILGGVYKSTAEAAPSAKTLKVGVLFALNWPLGVWAVDAMQIDVDRLNADGGLNIGGEKYKIELIVDDHKMDQAAAKTAAQRVIYQDKVKFILGDLWCDSYLPLTEKNKVLVAAWPASPPIYNPKFKYVYHALANNTTFPSLIPYLAKKFPDKKTFLGVFPDREDGRAYADTWVLAAKNSGLKVFDPIFYPPTATDLSAVGTKIKTLNPDLMCPFGGGPQMDAIVLKAAHAAGYRGQLMDTAPIPGGVMLALASADAIEGLITLAWPQEFDLPNPPLAQEWKEAYVAKHGKWDDADVVGTTGWWLLRAALQEAGSTDPLKVAAAINKGLEFPSIQGPCKMVARPDLGNDRTMETITAMPVKQVTGGKVKMIDIMTVQQAYDFTKIIYGWK
jgi:branched-chain amino acid transport system substrate-binding protein